mgnify:CR=1 FL=1
MQYASKVVPLRTAAKTSGGNVGSGEYAAHAALDSGKNSRTYQLSVTMSEVYHSKPTNSNATSRSDGFAAATLS